MVASSLGGSSVSARGWEGPGGAWREVFLKQRWGQERNPGASQLPLTGHPP